MRSRTASLMRFVLGAAFVSLFLCHTVDAQLSAGNVAVDENGNGIGTVGGGFLAPDPGPGGSIALTYLLPFEVVQGDIFLTDGGIPLDVIRFNDNSTLVFYSDNVDGFDALGDTVGPPGAFYNNQLRIAELGPEGNNGAFYTPTAGQPGFTPFAVATYHFVSDGTVPEPATLALLGLGLAGLGFSRRRRKLS